MHAEGFFLRHIIWVESDSCGLAGVCNDPHGGGGHIPTLLISKGQASFQDASPH